MTFLPIQQDQAGTPIRNTPIRIIVDENAKQGTGGYHRMEIDGLPILIAGVLTLGFAALTCWLWWTRANAYDATTSAAHRVGRRLGLTRAERTAVMHAASAARVEPAAMLLSRAVFDRCAPKGTREDAERLRAAREKLARALADEPGVRA